MFVAVIREAWAGLVSLSSLYISRYISVCLSLLSLYYCVICLKRTILWSLILLHLSLHVLCIHTLSPFLLLFFYSSSSSSSTLLPLLLFHSSSLSLFPSLMAAENQWKRAEYEEHREYESSIEEKPILPSEALLFFFAIFFYWKKSLARRTTRYIYQLSSLVSWGCPFALLSCLSWRGFSLSGFFLFDTLFSKDSKSPAFSSVIFWLISSDSEICNSFFIVFHFDSYDSRV